MSALPRRRQETDRQARKKTGTSAATARYSTTQLLGRLEAFTELRFAPESVAEIDEAVANLPELVESFTLAGDPDALIRLRVTDVDHFKRVIDRVRRGSGGGAKIIGTKTLIVLGTSTGPTAP